MSKTTVKVSKKTKAAISPKVEIAPKASPKVTAAIAAQVHAAANLVSKKRLTSEAIRSEAIRLGISDDQKKVREMVMDSWIAAHPKVAALSESERKDFIRTSQPDVSKIMTLAYPSNNSALKELTLAYQGNDALPSDTPTHERMGEGKLLRIARGELTYKQALQLKQASKRKSRLSEVVTPFQQFKNAMVAAIANARVGGKERISEADAKKAFNEALTEYVNKK